MVIFFRDERKGGQGLEEEKRRLVLTEYDEAVVSITLNNPPANVLSRAMVEQLSQVFYDLENINAAAVIITGQGARSFCAGADIRELTENESNQNRAYFAMIYQTLKLIANCKAPVLAAVNGYACGAGLELALCADIRVMDQKAQMAATGVNLNLVFCTQRLPRLIGPGRAKDMLLYARPVSSSEAREIGLAEHVALPGESYGKAREIAMQISKKGRIAVQNIKQTLNRGFELPLDEALDLESESINQMLDTGEFDRRARSFLDRHSSIHR